MGRALLEQLMTQQATIIAYANDFKLMMVMTLLAFPLILLIRTKPALIAEARRVEVRPLALPRLRSTFRRVAEPAQ